MCANQNSPEVYRMNTISKCDDYISTISIKDIQLYKTSANASVTPSPRVVQIKGRTHYGLETFPSQIYL